MKYILGVIAVVVILIVSIILIANRGDNASAPAGIEPDNTVNLLDFADRVGTVEFTQKGRITAADEYREIRITVGRVERTIDVIQGYDGEVIERKVYPNTEAAYASFVEGLARVGFATEQEAAYEDKAGVCPLGKRFDYALKDGTQSIVSLWSTSCSRRDGTFGGNQSSVRTLFTNQIPEYRQVARGVRL